MDSLSPVIHTASKVRPLLRELAARDAAAACCQSGTDRLLPIIWRGDLIGWCGWSHLEQAAVVLRPADWLAGFPSIDSIIYNVTVNQQMRQLFWFKSSLGGSPSGLTWLHLFQLGGWPTAGVWNGTAYTARPHDDTEIGAIYHGGNVSPATKHILSGHVRTQDINTQTVTDVFVLYDLVLSYDQCTVTSVSTNFINGSPPARYIGAGDPGLQIMSCGNPVATGGATFTTLKYTNIGGSAGQTVPVTLVTNVDVTPTTTLPPATAFNYTNSNQRGVLCAPLVSGDSGVKQLDSIAMSTIQTDKINYILGYLLAWMPARGTDAMHPFDFVRVLPSLPRIRDGACLTFAKAASTSVVWQADLCVGWA